MLFNKKSLNKIRKYIIFNTKYLLKVKQYFIYLKMSQTDININVGEPNLINPVNTKTTILPFNVGTDLKEYSRIFITREFYPFRLIHCCEAPISDYEIYGETEEKDKKLLFTSSYHYQCCNCCEQFIIGDLCCGYAC